MLQFFFQQLPTVLKIAFCQVFGGLSMLLSVLQGGAAMLSLPTACAFVASACIGTCIPLYPLPVLCSVFAFTQTHLHTDTLTHTRTHTHKHIHTYAHMHTHTL